MDKFTPLRSSSYRKQLALALLLATIVSILAAGCNRAFYRTQADGQVHCLVDSAGDRVHAPMEDFSIDPLPESRMFDPDNPDCPPMPPDDPVSHQLMQCVYGMKGAKQWESYGHTPYVQNPCWQNQLPRNEEGAVVVDRLGAMQLALINSREYQTELENLYLAALDVTFQRYRFDAQFLFSNDTFFDSQGPLFAGRPISRLNTDTDVKVNKLFATGGELVVGFANSLVWQFAGPDEYQGITFLDFNFVQPLLRHGGRAVVLERLTDAERALLANIRQMERFQCGFYTQIVGGQSPGTGPTRGSITVGSLSPGNNGGAGGIIALLRQEVLIQNQVQNVVALRDSLEQLTAFFEADEIDFFQVEQARLRLYNAQIQLLSLQNQYQTQLDNYKLTLGLPPSLEVRLSDPLLDHFNLIDPELTTVLNSVTALVAHIRDPGESDTLENLIPQLPPVVAECREQTVAIQDDLARLDEILPLRVKHLENLSQQPEFRSGEVDPAIVDPKLLVERTQESHEKYAELSEKLDLVLAQLEMYASMAADLPVDPVQREALRIQMKEDASLLSARLLELSLLQAVTRLETVTLKPIALSSPDAYRIACVNRSDWKNARAALVDRWRQIEVVANELENDLDIVFSGDLGTTDTNPWEFRGTNGRLRVGLEFDAPVPRLAERNAYREILIEYQRTRRAYYAFEDEVDQVLRQNLRDLHLAEINFEQRRAAVYVAARQVDLKQLDLLRKPAELGATTARDVVDALNALLDEQNAFLNVWVDYEIQLMNLAFNLGIMELDQNGMWIEEGFDENLKLAIQELSDPSQSQSEPLYPDPTFLPAPESLPTPTPTPTPPVPGPVDGLDEEPSLLPEKIPLPVGEREV